MFDIGGTELLVIAIVAIVVVGPKDLPRMLRTVGQFVGKAKMMAREFQSHFTEALNEAGVDDVRKEISRATSGTGVSDTLKPFTDVGNEIKKDIEKSASSTSTSTATSTSTSSGSTASGTGADASPDAQPSAGSGDAGAEAKAAGSGETVTDGAKPASS